MTSREAPLDVLILGGGAAGLWSLAVLREAGYQALLLESGCLGGGQTLQSQGIIHGGGKYGVRSVRHLEIARAHAAIPGLWREHLAGKKVPDLSGTPVLSQSCLMWSAEPGLTDKILGRLLPLAVGLGALNISPRRIPGDSLPPVLRKGAGRVYAMGEPVIATRGLIRSLAAASPGRVRSYQAGDEARGPDWELERPGRFRLRVFSGEGGPEATLRPKALVLAAGRGNALLLRRLGFAGDLAQERPLCMFLLRGPLPEVFGHAVGRGLTQVTVTSPERASAADERVWQLGGEIAERAAPIQEASEALAWASGHLGRWLPGLDLKSCRISLYRASRAEGKVQGGNRPGSEVLEEPGPGVLALWPTKLALVPKAAARVLSWVRDRIGEPSQEGEEGPWQDWPVPKPGAYPWEGAAWSSVP
jgi:glycine/D-amino acid oxidase-like deaminating enzyme